MCIRLDQAESDLSIGKFSYSGVTQLSTLAINTTICLLECWGQWPCDTLIKLSLLIHDGAFTVTSR